jgi:hypothetical protein
MGIPRRIVDAVMRSADVCICAATSRTSIETEAAIFGADRAVGTGPEGKSGGSTYRFSPYLETWLDFIAEIDDRFGTRTRLLSLARGPLERLTE